MEWRLSEMVSFSSIFIQNFKRFAGKHQIPLQNDSGRLTIVAANNGLGKSTMMESIQICLYGSRAIKHLHPDVKYHHWMKNAYSVQSDNSEKLHISLKLEDPAIGSINVNRTYWVSEEIKDIEREEFYITINGKPLEKESNTSTSSNAEEWLEDYLPYTAMRKFFVDGERLSELNPLRIESEIISGIDDAVGMGLFHRLKKHLNNVRRKTLTSLAPDESESNITTLVDIQEQLKIDLQDANIKSNLYEEELTLANSEIRRIQTEIEELTKDSGSENVQLRMNYAISQSELTSSRKELHQHLMESLPFVVLGIPEDLENWSLESIIQTKEAELDGESKLEFLRDVVSDSGLADKTQRKLINLGSSIIQTESSSESDLPLSNLELVDLQNIQLRYVELGMNDARDRISDSLEIALDRLQNFNRAEQDLRRASAGLGIGEKADQLKQLAVGIGTSQAELAQIRGEIKRLEEGIFDVERRIENIRQSEDKDSLLNRRITTIKNIESLTELVTKDVRAQFSEPLADSFREGFDLLSRKADLLEKVEIDSETYSPILSMKGFEGNWLERDLSATEKQHVGLSLVYALRRASTEWSRPLPVVIDTPTSRMDVEHKSWSVTRFYPMLSNQVIVFATSDDLAGGLYQELSQSGVVGTELLVEEVSENVVSISEKNLAEFFAV